MITGSLEIKLTTLTPIWTGGADGKSDRLHITGIIGSLRWWYEVIVRGLGGWACDPTDPNSTRCSYDDKKPETFDNVCNVCRIFGATGWARRFRIILTDERDLQYRNPTKPWDNHVNHSEKIVFGLSKTRKQQLLSEWRKQQINRKLPNWYLNGPPLFGSVGLNIIAIGPKEPASNEPFQLKVIDGLFQFIEEWGSLGAKPQMGLGVVQITSPRDRKDLLKYLYDFVVKDINDHVAMRQKKGIEVPKPNLDLPSLQNMFFARINTTQTPSIYETFDLKNELREEVFRETPPEGVSRKSFRESRAMRELRHQIMGYVRGNDRIGAKVLMSYPNDKGVIRMWGWIPQLIDQKEPEKPALLKIREYMQTKYGGKNTAWHRFDRDKHGDGAGFLKELCLRGEK